MKAIKKSKADKEAENVAEMRAGREAGLLLKGGPKNELRRKLFKTAFYDAREELIQRVRTSPFEAKAAAVWLFKKIDFLDFEVHGDRCAVSTALMQKIRDEDYQGKQFSDLQRKYNDNLYVECLCAGFEDENKKWDKWNLQFHVKLSGYDTDVVCLAEPYTDADGIESCPVGPKLCLVFPNGARRRLARIVIDKCGVSRKSGSDILWMD